MNNLILKISKYNADRVSKPCQRFHLVYNLKSAIQEYLKSIGTPRETSTFNISVSGYSILAQAIIFFLIASCTPTREEPKSLIPSLKVLGVTPTNVQEFQNTVTMQLEYLDYDGDIGSEDPDEKTLRVQDSRLDSADWYHIPPIAPIGEEVAIKGVFEVPLNTIFLLGNGQSEAVFFTVQIVDRAGNWSEAEISPTITVTR